MFRPLGRILPAFILAFAASILAASEIPADPVTVSLESGGSSQGNAYVWNDSCNLYLVVEPKAGSLWNSVKATSAPTVGGIPTDVSLYEFSDDTAGNPIAFFLVKSVASNQRLVVGSNIAIAIAADLDTSESVLSVFNYTIQFTRIAPDLPDQVQFSCRAGGGSDTGYWRHTIKAVADADNDFDLAALNVERNGWCADKDVYLTPGTYWAKPYDTLGDLSMIPSANPTKTTAYSTSNWHSINHVINHKQVYVNGVLKTANRDQIQAAIWNLRGFAGVSMDATAQALYNAATTTIGSAYVPGEGDLMGIIFPLDEKQGTFIEVMIDPYWVPLDTWNG